MTINSLKLKKAVSIMLLGSMLAAGAVVYADTALGKTAGAVGQKMERSVGVRADFLSTMVEKGLLTADEQTAIKNAMETAHQNRTADTAEAKTKPEPGQERVSPFDRLAQDGLIDQTLADKVDSYMDTQRAANLETELKPLVDSGAFADTASAKAGLDAVHDAMRTAMDAVKPAKPTDGDRASFKNLTDEEKAALKATMDAKRAEMQAQHDATETEVYAKLVSAGTLTQAQADALKSFEASKEGPMDKPGHRRP